ncbi:MAG: hypothetical protein ACK41T_03275 [Pseudobdellovibrio sp.]
MQTNYRIAQNTDIDSIYQFAEDRLRASVPDEMDLMMKVWESRFRKEALEHYLKMGWSFVGFDPQGKIVGFFIGQPLLFFEGQTQTLWVEMISAVDYKIEADLAEIAIRLARDKHFQRAILPQSVQTLHYERPYTFNVYSESCVWVKTTK